nr:hypothetical protein [Tanacetum cinerariifolium]
MLPCSREVIFNGDSPPPTRPVDGVETPYPPTAVEEKLARKNELKARGNFMPPNPDLVFANEHVVNESITSVPSIKKSEVKTSETKLKNVSTLIIKDWVSDSEDENDIETETKQIKPSFAEVKFVKYTKHVKSLRKSVKQEESNWQTKYPRKQSQSPRGNQRNWNNLMT